MWDDEEVGPTFLWLTPGEWLVIGCVGLATWMISLSVFS